MQTTRWPECSPVQWAENDYRIKRMFDDAAQERLLGPRDGIRRRLGHALIALGRRPTPGGLAGAVPRVRAPIRRAAAPPR